MGPASSEGITVTAGLAAEDMRSLKSKTGSGVKERGWRVGGVGEILREGDGGGWYGEEGIHILTSSYKLKREWGISLKI